MKTRQLRFGLEQKLVKYVLCNFGFLRFWETWKKHAKIYLLCDFQSKQTSFSDLEKLEIGKSMGWQEAKTRQLLTTLRENTSTKQNTSTTQSGQEQNHVNYAKHVNYGKWPEAKTHQLRFLNF